MINSKAKGDAGELEAAAKWSALFGVSMRRSQQYCGASDESDDVIGQPGLSIEVKRRQSFSVAKAVQKTVDDAAELDVAIVLHRADLKPWLVTLQLDDLPQLVIRLFHTLTNREL